jgi:MFS family permease
LALFGILYFTGLALSSVPLPWLSDQIGRKKLFFLTNSVQVAVYAVLLTSTNVYVAYLAMFIGGAATSGANLIGYVYMCDFLTENQQVFAATLINTLDAFNFMVITFYFDFLGKNATQIAKLGFAITLISFFGQFLVDESPIWCLKMGKMSEGQRILRQMCKVNGTNCDSEVWNLTFVNQ